MAAVPESLHLCPKCGDLASGALLCEDCVAFERLARAVDRRLRWEPALRVLDWLRVPTTAREWGRIRELSALYLLFLLVCAWTGFLAAAALWLLGVGR